MPSARNDPCPCGSGKKYKRCCQRADRAAGGAGRFAGAPGPEALYADPERAADLRRAAREDPTWEVAAIPIPTIFENEPEARPVLVLVATRDAVLSFDLLSGLSGEPEDVAEAMATQLRQAMRLSETEPRWVEVVHEEVAEALRSRKKNEGFQVRSTGALGRAWDPARSLVETMSGVSLWPPMSAPATFAAWGLPEQDVEELFRVAAGFFRAAPWEHLADADPLQLRFADGVSRVGTVLGAGGEVMGFTLYEELGDLLQIYEAGDARAIQDHLEGAVLTVLFHDADELPRPMRREVARRGWEVASPSGYPVLTALNTPGGGIRRDGLHRLTEAMAVALRFVEHLRRTGGGAARARWTDPESGTRVTPVQPSRPIDELPPLRSGAPQGPGARPGAVRSAPSGSDSPTRDAEEAFTGMAQLTYVLEFAKVLEEEGLGEATVRTHANNAEQFVRFLAFWEYVPVAAVHERDLRLFLHDWHPRHYDGGVTQARRVAVSLDRFFRFLDEEMGIRCPWAGEILDDREFIRLRFDSCPGADDGDPEVEEWRAEGIEELEVRCLRPAFREFEELEDWVDSPGMMEKLWELDRHWLRWRDELIEEGVVDPPEVRRRLVERQHAWAEEEGLVSSTGSAG